MNFFSKLPISGDPLTIVLVLSLFSLLPVLFVMCTAFLKISMVLILIRNALGVQQIPPNMAVYSLSFILTVFIMAPIGMDIYEALEKEPIVWSSVQSLEEVDKKILFSYREFLVKHAHPSQIDFFVNIPKDFWPEKYKNVLSKDSLLVLLPAFSVSQIIEAFKIGLLLYLPFIAIDLIVSNILLAMGMMMVSPMTISLPFKLLVFVIMNGWQKLFEQLTISFY